MSKVKTSAYEILDLKAGTSLEEIKKKYKQSIRQFTPEKDPEKFMAIREAYDFIFQPSIEISRFPMYQKPKQEAGQQENNKKPLPLTLLKEIYESPFNTALELREYLDQNNFNVANANSNKK